MKFFSTLLIALSFSQVMSQPYQIISSQVYYEISDDMILKSGQEPDNLAIWYVLKDGRCILSPATGGLWCLLFANEEDMFLMIREKNYPDIHKDSGDFFYTERARFKDVPKYEDEMIQELFQRLDLKVILSLEPENLKRIEKKFKKLTLEQKTTAYPLLGIYLGRLLRDANDLAWDAKPSYSGFEAVSIPFLKSKKGDKYEFWSLLGRATTKAGNVNIDSFLHTISYRIKMTE